MFKSLLFSGQDSIVRLRSATTFLYQRAGIGVLLTFVVTTLFTFLTSSNLPTDTKINLWIALTCVLILRSLDIAYWFINYRNTNYNPLFAFIRFSVGLIVTAMLWSLFTILLVNHFHIITVASALMISCALSSGAITILSSSKRLCIVYTTIIIIPLSVILINNANADVFILGLLGIGYWFIMLIVSQKNNKIIMETLELQYSNSTLVTEIETERDEINRINAELRRSNEALDHANASLELEVNKRTDDIHRLSSRDPLTGLMNRKGFMRLINKQIDTSEQMNNKFALLFIDLDGFKQVNDSLGHQVGDGVLEEIAQRLARYSDIENLGRWGGDEFVVLLPYADSDTAIAVAHATRSSIALPMEVMSNQVSLNATIGISLFPEHSTQAQGLIQLADLTMYEQKKNKPGSYAIFNQTLYTKLQHDLMYRDGLRSAIENNEFSLAYQPLVHSSDSSVWGFEALLRWKFNGQPVSPEAFIPLAEKTGLITDIGTWVLHRACIDAAQWHSQEHTVSINVSIIQLMDDSFISILDKVIESSGLSPKRLHLEITESVFADNKTKIQNQISAIKQRNIQISIDDFGTGFSSLSQLQSLSFDHIKIDRAFVQNLEEGSDTIIRATLLMAKEFKCITVAEGIETSEHAERLTFMGVNLLQGYYFAKPMANNAIPNWLIQHNERV